MRLVAPLFSRGATRVHVPPDIHDLSFLQPIPRHA